jgi:asparagine synthase (glutamine-hydrolysing)
MMAGLLERIRHRGPDDRGVYAEDGVALGMQRLSIIDLDGGRQPMIDPKGRYVLVFNGEIYNFRELRRELASKGHVFRTRSDTEVILHGYCQWGESVVQRLDGMFALAVYDTLTREVFLARDHFGIKPLYYAHGKGVFVFCSEPAPLWEVPDVARRLDLRALRHFLTYKYVPAPLGFTEGMEKLEPGTSLRVDFQGRLVGPRRYWRLSSDESSPSDPGELKGHLLKAVERQLVADVPVGVFLSGGIDSGLLLWAARQSNHSADPAAFTVGFDEPSFDETRLASKTATHLGAEHHVERLPLPAADELDDMIVRFGEPFANISVPASFVISRAAARHVKVVLNGSGADELFGGYDRYYAVRPPVPLAIARTLWPLLLPIAWALPVGAGKGSKVERTRRFLSGVFAPPARRHAIAIRLFTGNELRQLAPGLPDIEDDPILSGFDQAPGHDDLGRATWVDICTMMADDYLNLVDRTSMAHSLEVRVPYLDVELARYAFSLMSSSKIRRWAKKWILRRLAADCLPAEVSRGGKQGLESPVGAWFRGPLGSVLMARLRRSPLRDVVSLRFVEDLLARHAARRSDSAKQLLGLYTLCVWTETQRITI